MPKKTPATPSERIRVSDPVWVKGEQSGRDYATNKWRLAGGVIADRGEVLAQHKSEIMALGGVIGQYPRAPLSTAAEDLERIIAGGLYPTDSAPKRKVSDPCPIPGNVLATYRLAEYYYGSEGDIATALETPVQVSMRDPVVYCPDPEVKKDMEEMYDVNHLNLRQLMMDIWLSVAVYGIAHPFEVWDGDNIEAIVLLPPPYVSVGSYLSGDYLFPINDAAKWTKKSAEALLPTHLYNAIAKPTENVPSGKLLLPEGLIYSVRALDQRWTLYPKPILKGAFRALSTRMVYEEMRRALYEQYRHQLWLFKLGDMEHKPTPEMMKHLTSLVDGAAGDRTGSMVFWGGLSVEVIAPQVDDILKSSEWWALSIDIFRRLGINMRVATGNTIPDDRSTDFELDVNLMLEKFELMRSQLLAYERGFRLRWAAKRGPRYVEAAKATRVVFSLNMMELKEAIKNRLLPLFTSGVLSPQTLLSRAGQSYEVERENKLAIKDKGEEQLWHAPPTFSQTTVNPDTAPKSSSVTDKGRPPVGAKASVEILGADSAAVEDKKKKYLALILAALFAHATDPSKFISELKRINTNELAGFSDIGYRQAKGGGLSVPQPWGDSASAFVNSFADKFGSDMQAGVGSIDYQTRALMYGQEGYRTALLHGIQAAMSERGASHWRRVLRPELSKTGPCPLCIQDAQTLHTIDEAFMALHNNDVCSMAPLNVRFSGSGEEVEYGVPGFTQNELTNLLKESTGGAVEDNVRRKRVT